MTPEEEREWRNLGFWIAGFMLVVAVLVFVTA